MRFATLIVLVFCFSCSLGHIGTYVSRTSRGYTPYRPTRWVPRAFWYPQKRGINSAGARSYMSRYHRSDPGMPLYDDETEELAALRTLDDSPYDFGSAMDKRGRYGNKYDDNKSYGFWISALNKAGNMKRGDGEGIEDSELE